MLGVHCRRPKSDTTIASIHSTAPRRGGGALVLKARYRAGRALARSLATGDVALAISRSLGSLALSHLPPLLHSESVPFAENAPHSQDPLISFLFFHLANQALTY